MYLIPKSMERTNDSRSHTFYKQKEHTHLGLGPVKGPDTL